MRASPNRRVLGTFVLCALNLVGAVSTRADEIWLKNGDHLTGTVQSMTGGNLVLATDWGGTVTVKWSEVVKLKTAAILPLVLTDDTRLIGSLDEPGAGEEGMAGVKGEKLKGKIRLGDVTAINPPAVPPVTFTGFIRIGAVITDGNTRTREANAAGEVTARSERLRLLLRGQWNYGENKKDGELFKRNTLGEIKMDFFVLKKLFLYANCLFQSDKFQDLDLRTALGAGAGYQWIEEAWLSIFTEAGLSYVVDDHDEGEDTNTLAVRVAWKINWQVIPNVDFFHSGEAFPSVEDEEDVFVNTTTGFKFTLLDGLFASIQVDFRWDNQPSGGFGRRDVSYIFSIGYKF
jgi:putative salt-induced outer membrane protein YdiY